MGRWCWCKPLGGLSLGSPYPHVPVNGVRGMTAWRLPKGLNDMAHDPVGPNKYTNCLGLLLTLTLMWAFIAFGLNSLIARLRGRQAFMTFDFKSVPALADAIHKQVR